MMIIPAPGPVSDRIGYGSHAPYMVASTFMSLAGIWLVYTKSTSDEAEVAKYLGNENIQDILRFHCFPLHHSYQNHLVPYPLHY